jgi:hypothetical protein
MLKIIATVLMIGFVTMQAAQAQTTAPNTSTPPPSSTTSTAVENVSKWTTKHWNAVKAKWAKNKEKWTDCRQQSDAQKLSGRKSWSFLATCMTS